MSVNPLAGKTLTFGGTGSSETGDWWKGRPTGLPTPRQLMESYGGRYVLYTLIAAVCIGVTIVIVDAFYPFLPSNPFGGLSSTARQGKTFWAGQVGDGENLIVPADKSPTIRPDVYSMTVQMIISDSRTPALGKYRHVLHRGSNPCGLTATASGASGHSGIKLSDLPPGTDVTAYGAQGLPQIMNPGLFLDKFNNDLHIFVHTKGTDGLILESTTVSDLPLGQTLSIGLVCNQKALEVYVNCRLYTTLLFKGRPYLPKHNNNWYGRYCAFPFLGALQNLTLWDAPLLTTDVIRVCRSGMIQNAPTPCPNANTCAPAATNTVSMRLFP